MPHGIRAVSTVASLDYPSLFAQPGLQNCADQEITLSRHTTVGFIENLNDPQFERVTPAETTELQNSLHLQNPCQVRKGENF